MQNFYTNEPEILELVALLKAHGIRRAIVSPGSTNISLAASLLYDSDIQTYSAVDERSAAYMACGMAEETGEPILISCTGATAARNYVPALTEAFYRKLPVLCVTSSQYIERKGQGYPQVTDRSNPMNDLVIKSVQIPIAHSENQRWSNNIKMNDALLELKRHGGGPVHINIETSFNSVFDRKQLPTPRIIRRFYEHDDLPEIKADKVAIFVGSHSKFSEELTQAVDIFCESYNAVVLCDQTSNYKGKYRVLAGLVERQKGYKAPCREFGLLIHLGEVSGAYFSLPKVPVWRVNRDGEIRDTFGQIQYVFEMDECTFFKQMNNRKVIKSHNTYLTEWKSEDKRLRLSMPELPLSNAWIASQTAHRIPPNAEIHFGILNSLRMWNLFEVPNSVYGYSNVGGFGIDGCISSCIGASLSNADKIYFCVLGDLATFYDLNSLGNRHIGNNVRILVVNNGTGFEMRHRGNRGDVFKEDADVLFAAAGHFGNKSRMVLKHFSEDLGFKYLSAETKEEYLALVDYFASEEPYDKPILFEVFVDTNNEYNSYNLTQMIIQDSSTATKKLVKNIIGAEGTNRIKHLLKK